MKTPHNPDAVAPWAYFDERPLRLVVVVTSARAFVAPLYKPEVWDMLDWELPSILSQEGAWHVVHALHDEIALLKHEFTLRRGPEGPKIEFTPAGRAAIARIDEYTRLLREAPPRDLCDEEQSARNVVEGIGREELVRRVAEWGDPSLLEIELREQFGNRKTRIMGDLAAAIGGVLGAL